MRRTPDLLLVALLVVPALLAPGVARAQDSLAPVKTDFDPGKDGVPFPNVGSFASPEGDCVGFSAVAIANAQSRTQGGAAALDGLPAEAQAIAVQAAYEQKLHDASYFFGEGDPLRITWKAAEEAALGQTLHDALAKSGPQILEIRSPAFGNAAHAIVVYGYEAGHFLVYDSNHPDEVGKLAFDAKKGFGSLAPYGAIPKLKLLVDAADLVALAKTLQPHCSNLDGTCAADVWKVSAERLPSDTAVVFSGSVSGGMKTTSAAGKPTAAPSVVVALAPSGQRLGFGRVQADGSFELTLPRGASGPFRFWVYTDGSQGGVPQIAGYSTAPYDVATGKPVASASASPSGDATSGTSTNTGTSTSKSGASLGLTGALSSATADAP